MSSRSLTWLPIVLLLLAAAGAGTWLYLKGPARPNIERDLCAGDAGGHVARGGKTDATRESATNQPQDRGGKVAPAPDKPTREATKLGEPEKPAAGRGGGEEVIEPFSVEEPPEQPNPGGQPDGPRGVKLPQTPSAATPVVKQPTGYTALKGALEPAQWDEYWSKRGMHAPEAVSTPVRGKIMSRATNKGEAAATVGLIVFFAESEAPLAPLLPVIHEFTADKDGVFSGTVSAPRKPLAEDKERLALYVSAGGERKIIGQPVAGFIPGTKNELGIFWTPLDEVRAFRCSADDYSGSRRVVATGELDPRRWQIGCRVDIFAAFLSSAVATENEATFTLGVRMQTRQFFSLLCDEQWTQSHGVFIHNKQKPGTTSTHLFSFSVNSNLLSGFVVNEQGIGLAGAVVRFSPFEDAPPVVADSRGHFSFDHLADGTFSNIVVDHPDYLSETANVTIGDTNTTIVLTRPKPRISLRVLDGSTSLSITSFSLRVLSQERLPEKNAKVVPVETPDGEFILIWDMPLISITVEKLGYMPFKYEVAKDKQRPETTLEVRLAPGRRLEVRPRDYTAVNAADKWFGDDKAADGSDPPGIRTYWADQWIEWEVDFGDPPLPGVMGGCFDLILGCTNFGMIDNEYKFKVDVLVDGANKGTLEIKADSAKEITGRLSLGALGGKHRVRLVWKNDAYIEGQLDANIRYASVKFLEQPPG